MAYKARIRPAMQLYHDDMEKLTMLPPEQFKTIIVELLKYSEALANHE